MFANTAIQGAIHEPATYKEAMRSPNCRRQWAQAIEEELTSLASNGTWELVELPKGRQPITSKWVFKVKYTPSGLVDRFKARLVARGFSQQYGIDYEETFAPTLRFDSLRMLLAIAAYDDLHLHQMDVVSAYLAGELEEEIYMGPSRGLALQATRGRKNGLSTSQGTIRLEAVWARLEQHLPSHTDIIGIYETL